MFQKIATGCKKRLQPVSGARIISALIHIGAGKRPDSVGGQLLNLAINHMTCPDFSFEELLDVAALNNCVGVEVRNDLSGEIFSDASPAEARAIANSKQLRILGVAQVNDFNRVSAMDANLKATQQLLDTANASGAESICLIPRNDGEECEFKVRTQNLHLALQELKPLFKASGIVGLIEPLGFTSSSLRMKAEAVDAIVETDSADCFKLVHDTFHHHVAGEKAYFASHTAMVHVSGVVDKNLKLSQMQDSHRVLVNEYDQLNNVNQLRTLVADGYLGPVSMEVFAPEVQKSPDLATELRDSFNFINSGLVARVADAV